MDTRIFGLNVELASDDEIHRMTPLSAVGMVRMIGDDAAFADCVVVTEGVDAEYALALLESATFAVRMLVESRRDDSGW